MWAAELLARSRHLLPSCWESALPPPTTPAGQDRRWGGQLLSSHSQWNPVTVGMSGVRGLRFQLAAISSLLSKPAEVTHSRELAGPSDNLRGPVLWVRNSR